MNKYVWWIGRGALAIFMIMHGFFSLYIYRNAQQIPYIPPIEEEIQLRNENSQKNTNDLGILETATSLVREMNVNTFFQKTYSETIENRTKLYFPPINEYSVHSVSMPLEEIPSDVFWGQNKFIPYFTNVNDYFLNTEPYPNMYPNFQWSYSNAYLPYDQEAGDYFFLIQNFDKIKIDEKDTLPCIHGDANVPILAGFLTKSLEKGGRNSILCDFIAKREVKLIERSEARLEFPLLGVKGSEETSYIYYFDWKSYFEKYPDSWPYNGIPFFDLLLPFNRDSYILLRIVPAYPLEKSKIEPFVKIYESIANSIEMGFICHEGGCSIEYGTILENQNKAINNN